MIENPGHVAVAQNIVKQLEQAKIPSITQAALDAGYSERSAVGIQKAESFHRALFRELPYEVLAAIQAKQLQAKREKVLTFFDAQPEEVADICREQGWIVLNVSEQRTDMSVRVLVLKENYEVIDKALDKIYKLQGLYAAEKHEINKPLEELTDSELLEEIQEQGIIEQKAHVQVINDVSTEPLT